VEVLPVVPVVPGVDPFDELDALDTLDALGEGDVEPLPRAPALEEPHAARARESSTSARAAVRPRDRPSIDIFIRQIILGLPRRRLSQTAAKKPCRSGTSSSRAVSAPAWRRRLPRRS